MFRRAYFSIAIFAIAVLALLTPPQNSITVIATSQETRFPEEVVFTLEAQSSSEIVEVTFFYRVAGAKVSSYSYLEFAQGHHVIAKTTVKTNGGSYIPPGVDIRYHYLIRDTEGNEFETSPQLYKYRDPRFEWHELTDGFLTVLWHDYSEEAVRERVSEVKARLATVARVFGLQGDLPQVRAILYRSSSGAAQIFPLVSETASQQHIYGGFAFA